MHDAEIRKHIARCLMRDEEIRKQIAQLTGRVERLERLLVALTEDYSVNHTPEPEGDALKKLRHDRGIPEPDGYRCINGRDCTMPWTPHDGWLCANKQVFPDSMTGEIEDTGTIVRGDD